MLLEENINNVIFDICIISSKQKALKLLRCMRKEKLKLVYIAPEMKELKIRDSLRKCILLTFPNPNIYVNELWFKYSGESLL